MFEEERIFIAYKGEEVSKTKIENILYEKCSIGMTVRTKSTKGIIFSKVVDDYYEPHNEPVYSKNVLTVSSYNKDELIWTVQNGPFSTHIDENKIYDYYKFINEISKKSNAQVFKDLKPSMSFSSVSYNIKDKTLIAGIANNNNPKINLYYGYTKQNHELMFSNDETILKQFCDEITQMQDNTYMKNGTLYDLNSQKIEEISNELIPNNEENANAFFAGLNNLLIQITNDSVKSKIEKNIEDYLASDDPKKKISDYILNELDNETKKQVLKIIKEKLKTLEIEREVTRELFDEFDKKLEEYIKQKSIPVVHIIKLEDTKLGQTKGGFYHEKFEQILSQVQLDEPIMLIGPSGSGKNVAVSQVADALGQHMYYTNNASNEFKLTGFIDAGGNYRDTEFYKAFKNGGIFFLDEIDNSDPSALIVINSALANGYMAFPHETIDRHQDFRIISAANTWGKGADLQYIGRNALDGATLDRFDNIFFDYDEKLEQALYPNEEVLMFMWAFRDSVYKSKIPYIVSTRGIGKVYKKEINNIPIEDILTSNIVKNLNQDDINTIIGNMNNLDGNKFYEGIKKLELKR